MHLFYSYEIVKNLFIIFILQGLLFFVQTNRLDIKIKIIEIKPANMGNANSKGHAFATGFYVGR